MVGTSAHAHQVDQLAKLVDSLPISPHSLFGEGLQWVIAKAASSARSYVDMVDRFVQVGLVRLRPPVPNRLRDGCKRKRVDSPPPFAHAVASPPSASTTDPPRKGGSRSATAHQGPLTSPRECRSPPLGRKSSPKANSREKAEEERNPSRPDMLSSARAGSRRSRHGALWPDQYPSPCPPQDHPTLSMETSPVSGQRSQCQVA